MRAHRTAPVLAASSLATLAALTALVILGSPLWRLDAGVRDTVGNQAASPGLGPLTTVAQWLADLGSLTIAVPVLVAAAAVSGTRQRSLRPPALALASVTALLLTVIPAKLLIARVGPSEVPLRPDQWGFFPSGHAATAAVCYGAAVCLLAPLLAAPVRRTLTGALAVLNAGIGWALIWRGYHWLADVLGAWALSLFLLALLFPAGTGDPDRPGRHAERRQLGTATADAPRVTS